MTPNPPSKELVIYDAAFAASQQPVKVAPVLAPTTPGFAVLYGLNRLRKHVYGGTVPAHVIERRRKADKAAKIARRANRA